MNAIVVYESLWGNTAAVAHAIAEGMGSGAKAMSTAEADAKAVADAELVVCGAPLLGFSLPTDEMRETIANAPGNAPAPPNISHPSMRDWLAALPAGYRKGAAFETRIWWSPGSAAKTIEAKLHEAGYRVAAPAEKFVVKGKFGPLKDGELDRAREWGKRLAAGSAA